MAWLVLLAALGAFVALVTLLTPWNPLPSATISPAPLSTYFTPAQVARSDAFFSAARWPSWLGLLLGLAIAVALGFTRLGRLLIGAVRNRVRRWWLQVLGMVALVLLIERLVELPTDIWSQQVSRSYGLSTESWASWAVDKAKSLGIAFVVTALVLSVSRRSGAPLQPDVVPPGSGRSRCTRRPGLLRLPGRHRTRLQHVHAAAGRAAPYLAARPGAPRPRCGLRRTRR